MDTPPRRFRFTIRELFLLVLVVALAVGWLIDHRRLEERLNSVGTERRYVNRLTSGAAKKGMTQDEVRLALGAPHVIRKSKWYYHYEQENSGMLIIRFDNNNMVESVTP